MAKINCIIVGMNGVIGRLKNKKIAIVKENDKNVLYFQRLKSDKENIQNGDIRFLVKDKIVMYHRMELSNESIPMLAIILNEYFNKFIENTNERV